MTPSEPAAAPRLTEPPPLLVAVLVGAAQGVALWSLWSGPDGTGGSALDRLGPEVRAALIAALLIVPTSVPFLSAFVGRSRRLDFGVLIVAALAALLAAQSAVLAVLFAPTAIVLAHAAALSPGAPWWRPEYAAVWRSASSNLALLGGSAVFAGAFGAILALTAALFDAVGLTAVGRVLGDEVVAVPLGAAAFSVGAVLLRRGRWLDGVASALATGLGWLAPVLLLVTVLFALSLPAAGLADLEGLFEGLLSSGLYLALVVGVVLLLSAAHADGVEGVVFPAPLRRFVRLALFALPLFALLALYGLSRRVAAYGLTEERVLGVALGSVLLIVAVGYAVWPRSRAARLERLGDVNLVGLALVGLVCLVLGVPGLRPIDLAARSQAARVANPDTPRSERALAVRHLAYEAGDTGRAALRRLSTLDLPPQARAQVTFALREDWTAFSNRYVEETNLDRAVLVPLRTGEVDMLTAPQRRAVSAALRGAPNFTPPCADAAVTRCELWYALGKRGGETLVFVFSSPSFSWGVYLEVGASSARYLGTLSTSAEVPTKPELDLRDEARAGVRIEAVKLQAVRLGTQTVFLRPAP